MNGTATNAIARSTAARRASAGESRRGARVVVGAGGDKPPKPLSREAEPEEYWMDKNTAAGKSPFSDPLAIIGIAAIFLPFLILGIAIATGYVEIGG